MIISTAPRAYGVIYLITNTITGARYVGQTTRPPGARWGDHKRTAGKVDNERPLYRAMRKYGIAAFSFDVIWHAPDRASLDASEIGLIQLFETIVPEGYNLSFGGRNEKHSETSKQRLRDTLSKPEVKDRLIEATRSAMRRPDVKQKMLDAWTDERKKRLSIKNTGAGNPLFGKRPSQETREAMSRAGKKKPPRSEETRRRLSLALAGKPKSKETKALMSAAKKGKPMPAATLIAAIASNTGGRWINNGTQQRVLPVGIDIPNGWVYGMMPHKNTSVKSDYNS